MQECKMIFIFPVLLKPCEIFIVLFSYKWTTKQYPLTLMNNIV